MYVLETKKCDLDSFQGKFSYFGKCSGVKDLTNFMSGQDCWLFKMSEHFLQNESFDVAPAFSQYCKAFFGAGQLCYFRSASARVIFCVISVFAACNFPCYFSRHTKCRRAQRMLSQEGSTARLLSFKNMDVWERWYAPIWQLCDLRELLSIANCSSDPEWPLWGFSIVLFSGSIETNSLLRYVSPKKFWKLSYEFSLRV